MSQNYAPALQLVLAHEGGYVNHPQDPGGATNKGITQRVYNAYRRRNGQPPRSVKEISNLEVSDIYRKEYWDASGANIAPAGIDYALFDYSVNSGVNRAVKDLQRTLNETRPKDKQLGIDGEYGSMTHAAVCEAADADEINFIERYCDRRMKFFKSLKTFKTFGRGWTRRLLGDKPNPTADEGDNGVLDYAVKFAKEDLQYPIPPVELPTPIGNKQGEPVSAKADQADQKVVTPTTKGGAGAILASTGTAGQTLMTAAEQVKPHMSDGPFANIAMILFALMMIIGVSLLVYSFIQKSRELA